MGKPDLDHKPGEGKQREIVIVPQGNTTRTEEGNNMNRKDCSRSHSTIETLVGWPERDCIEKLSTLLGNP